MAFLGRRQAFKPVIKHQLPASGGGTTYNDTITETVTAGDSYSAALTGTATLTESGSVTDSFAGSLTGTASLTEAGTAADSYTASLAATAALTETAASGDSYSAALTGTANLTESGAATDGYSGTLTVNDSLTESGTAGDALVAGFSDTITETVTAGDSYTATVTVSESLTETVAADVTMTAPAGKAQTGGGGYRLPKKKAHKQSLDIKLEEQAKLRAEIEDAYESLHGVRTPEAKKAVEVVLPFAERRTKWLPPASQVDFEALASDLAAAKKLLQLHQAQVEEQINDEEAFFMLLAS